MGLARAEAFFRRQFFQVTAHVEPEGGVPAIRAAPQAEVIAAVEMPFADIGGVKAVVSQPLSDGFDVVAEGHHVGPGAGAVRIGAGKKRRARWLADRLASISTLEKHTFRGQPVQARCLHVPIAIAAEHVPALGVGHKQHDFAGGGGITGVLVKWDSRQGALRLTAVPDFSFQFPLLYER